MGPLVGKKSVGFWQFFFSNVGVHRLLVPTDKDFYESRWTQLWTRLGDGAKNN